MKTKNIALSMIFLSLVLACNTHKDNSNHKHNSYSDHSHATKNTLNNPKDYYGNYKLEDENFGTKTSVTIKDNKRIMVSNSLPNHNTGNFPNKGNPNVISAQNKTYFFPLIPKYTGKAKWMREPGIALNGVKFEPGTAEVVECDSGENYRVEAIQNAIDLGLDFNNAHVQPNGAYHYHGSPTSIISTFDKGEDLVHIGFAHDGFPIYTSKSGKYKPSFKLLEGYRNGLDCTYENPMQSMDISVNGHHDGTYGSDYEYVANSGDLDECNGIIIEGKYMYLVTKEFPYVGRCLMGEVEQEDKKAPPNRQEGQRNNGERPNSTTIINQLDANKDGKLSKSEVKGPLKHDFDKIDTNTDGFISKTEIEKGATNRNGQNRQRPPEK